MSLIRVFVVWLCLLICSVVYVVCVICSWLKCSCCCVALL